MSRYNTSIISCLFEIFKSTCDLDEIQNALQEIVPNSQSAMNVASAYNLIKMRSEFPPSFENIVWMHRTLYQNIDRFAGICKDPSVPQKLTLWAQEWEVTGKKEDCLGRYEKFLGINPFYDGNKRLAKMLLIWDMTRNKIRTDTMKKQFATKD
jgi:hypothetical protein